MAESDASMPDSLVRVGGTIPASADLPAFTLTGSRPSPLPVLVSVPHAGRTYPEALWQGLRHPEQTVLRLEDRYVDRLGTIIARESGAMLVVAHAPRAMIDLNRSTDDVDWGMVAGGRGLSFAPPSPGHRARTGLGLVPRRMTGVGELWKAPIAEADLRQRITDVHEPYHAAVATALAELRARWGAALLVDLHSMPPLPGEERTRAQIVLGDRYGASCDGRLAAAAFGCLQARQVRVAHNRPYAGGHVLNRHGTPRHNIHAIQIEVDRSTYLDSRLDLPGEGLERMAEVLVDLVRTLAGEVTIIGAVSGAVRWAEAAE